MERTYITPTEIKEILNEAWCDTLDKTKSEEVREHVRHLICDLKLTFVEKICNNIDSEFEANGETNVAWIEEPTDAILVIGENI